MIEFYKYQGTGNDFVMIDNRMGLVAPENLSFIKKICSRRFGVGADGLILISKHGSLDFQMTYFNSDGSRSFCGNGARCAVQFANFLGMIDCECSFAAIDGQHEAKIENGLVSILMQNVQSIQTNESGAYVLDTGSPHYVAFTDSLSKENIVEVGKSIRYSKKFSENGINVNLVEIKKGLLQMLTYERGVEDETLSCGTGATAVALAYAYQSNIEEGDVNIQVAGGDLNVSFKKSANEFHNIWLTGPAKQVFKGIFEYA